jgi:hypothetical protein
MIAWKNAKPKSSGLNIICLLQSFSSVSSSRAYVLSKLDLNPEGGSRVIFTPFYNTDIGNELVGIEVSHSRKSLFMLSSSSSQILSKSVIQDIAKWQF